MHSCNACAKTWEWALFLLPITSHRSRNLVAEGPRNMKSTRPFFCHLCLAYCCRSSREYGVVGRGDTSYIFMLCSCRLNKCSISYWQSIMNFNTIKQQIEMIIMKNRWLYSLLLVSIIYLVLFYFNFTAYIGDYFEEEKYGFCMHCNGSVICGTCKCARTVLHWIVKWWRLSLLHTLWKQGA